MRYTVGSYRISTDKEFETPKEAVEYIQERHPELSEKEILTNIKPSIKENDTDNGGGLIEESKSSREGSAKADKSRASGEQVSGNKSR